MYFKYGTYVYGMLGVKILISIFVAVYWPPTLAKSLKRNIRTFLNIIIDLSDLFSPRTAHFSRRYPRSCVRLNVILRRDHTRPYEFPFFFELIFVHDRVHRPRVVLFTEWSKYTFRFVLFRLGLHLYTFLFFLSFFRHLSARLDFFPKGIRL